MKILISAYALSPYKGSEFGAAWDTILHLSKAHDLWVIYGASDDHMGDTQTMQQFLSQNQFPSITFIEVQPNKIASTINFLNKAGLIWFFYMAFYIWQKQVLNVAREIIKREDIDIIHQLGPIGFREPGFLWKINKPFVWGPIGGTSTVDKRLMQGMNTRARITFTIKNFLTSYQLKNSRRVRNAALRADALIGARRIDAININRQFNKRAFYYSEQGVRSITSSINNEKFAGLEGEVRLVWIGRMDHNKNVGLLLQALAKVPNKNWSLTIVGTGPLSSGLQQEAAELGIGEKINWAGQIPRSEVVSILTNAHLHVITSFMEGNPAVLFEALSSGVPTLTIDHCGMADVVCDKCGIKVPVDDYDKVVVMFADTIQQLLENPSRLVDLSRGTAECAKAYSWEQRLRVLDEVYASAITNFRNRELNHL